MRMLCADFLRTNFESAGVDPAFRILDDAVNARLRDEALSEAMEEAYANGEDAALAALDYGRGPGGVRQALEILFSRMEERPDPEAWVEKAAAADAPAMIDSGLGPVEKMLRDTKCDVCEIVTNAPEAFANFTVPVRTAPHPMMLYNIQGKLEKSLRRKVWLDCGGNLVIDPCEALTVFDVNSAKDLGTKKGATDTLTRLNIEAAKEIARLLRLRRIGGIVLIDFVDMQTDAERAYVRDALEEALFDDPVKTVIHGFTALGLMEISRKKTSAQLAQINDTPCPHCRGTGILETRHE